jgi:hypothetical protein
MNIQPPRSIPSPLLSEWISSTLSLKKQHMTLSSFLTRVRGSVETETTMSAGEQLSSGRHRAPWIEEKRNAKRRRNWIHARPARWRRRGKRRWAPERGQVAVEWTQCQRWASSTESSWVSTKGQAAARRSVPVRGARSGRGACLTFASTSV